MKDVFGITLTVGDTVVYILGTRLHKGEVTKLDKGKVSIKVEGYITIRTNTNVSKYISNDENVSRH